jgi:hypothetical protein
MKLQPGLVVLVNKAVVAAVSSENLNILSVRIHGDVLSPEVGVLDVTGGYYGDPEETKHLLWVTEHEISELDEIDIQFQDIPVSSHVGRTIEEVYPEANAPVDGQPLDVKELAEHLQEKSRLRSGFDLHVRVSDAEPQVFRMKDPDYSFFISIIWDWKSVDSAKLSVSSTTIQNIAWQKPGTSYLRQRLGLGQSVNIRIFSQ